MPWKENIWEEVWFSFHFDVCYWPLSRHTTSCCHWAPLTFERMCWMKYFISFHDSLQISGESLCYSVFTVCHLMMLPINQSTSTHFLTLIGWKASQFKFVIFGWISSAAGRIGSLFVTSVSCIYKMSIYSLPPCLFRTAVAHENPSTLQASRF